MQWLNRLLRTGTENKGSQGLPRELVLIIENADVFFRSSRNEMGDPYAVVSAAYLGKWKFDGIDDAADRVSKAYPDLNRQTCIRAGKLIGVIVGRANRAGKQRKSKPRSLFDPTNNLDENWRI